MFFAAYSLAAAVYRWVVLFSILWFLNQVFEPYGVKVIGQMIAVVSIASLVGQPLFKVYKFFTHPGRLRKVKSWRLYTTLAVLGAVIAAILFVPLPYRVFAPFEIRPAGAAVVYVQQPGILESVAVKPDEEVVEGQTLAVLVNRAIDVEVLNLEARIETIDQQVAANRFHFTNAERTDERNAIQSEINNLLELRETAEEQLAIKQLDQDRLTLKAPRGGTLIPPEYAPPQDLPQRLPRWYGTPLEPRNLGAYLDLDAKFCYIGDPTKMEASIAVDQSEIDFVREGQKVNLMLALDSGRLYRDLEVAKKLNSAMTEVPRALSDKYGGGLLSQMDEDGVERPLYPTFQVRVPVDNSDGSLSPGLRGEAKIFAGYQTLAYRLYRYFSKTFNFDL